MFRVVSGSVRIPLAFLVTVTGCLRSFGSQPPPASPATLFCALNQLTRLGYVVAPDPGSAWNQATRVHAGIGESLWIRLVDDGRRPAWLDIRVNGWSQQPQMLPGEGEVRSNFFRMTSWQGEEDVRALRRACETA